MTAFSNFVLAVGEGEVPGPKPGKVFLRFPLADKVSRRFVRRGFRPDWRRAENLAMCPKESLEPPRIGHYWQSNMVGPVKE
jgi:hypothetical protein